MRADLRRHLRPGAPEPVLPAVRRGPPALVLVGLVVACASAPSGAVSVVRDGDDDGATPDGASYGASNGDSAIGSSTVGDCEKDGPWHPPARDPARATVVEDMGPTCARAGGDTATFTYEADPFACGDGVTGRGDRPYSGSAVGTATVAVR